MKKLKVVNKWIKPIAILQIAKTANTAISNSGVGKLWPGKQKFALISYNKKNNFLVETCQ